MPCFLFTFHAHGSWLPDHPRGYVRRGRGVQATDYCMAARYGENLKHRVAVFDEAAQRLLIDAVRAACECQQCRCHAMATETTHVHVLVSWPSTRTWELVRKQLGHGITRTLNAAVERRPWLCKSPSRRQVKELDHFHYLMGEYLPSHRGWKWCEKRGLYL